MDVDIAMVPCKRLSRMQPLICSSSPLNSWIIALAFNLFPSRLVGSELPLFCHTFSFFCWNMAYGALHVGFNPYDKNLLLIIYHQARKYRIAASFEAIDAPDFNTLFICLEKCYIQYNISNNQPTTC